MYHEIFEGGIPLFFSSSTSFRFSCQRKHGELCSAVVMRAPRAHACRVCLLYVYLFCSHDACAKEAEPPASGSPSVPTRRRTRAS